MIAVEPKARGQALTRRRSPDPAPDRAAFTELFERHRSNVWNYAYRLTGSWSAAEDVAANTFLIAWRKLGTLDLDESPLPWLYTVAANVARTDARSAGRFRRALSRLPRPEPQRDHADAVANSLDTDQYVRRVAAAVRALPKGERQAVELCLIGELSTAEAARALGVSEGSIRTRISRARTKLRALLKEDSE